MKNNIEIKHDINLKISKLRAGEFELIVEFPYDEPGILYKISAVLYIRNWNILELIATPSDADGVFDKFVIKSMESGPIFLVQKALLMSDLRYILKKEVSVSQYLMFFKEKRKTGINMIYSQPVVHVTKSKKEKNILIIKIFASDRPGLIFSVVEVLYHLYFNISSMRSDTKQNIAYDEIVVQRDLDKVSENDEKILKESLKNVLQLQAG